MVWSLVEHPKTIRLMKIVAKFYWNLRSSHSAKLLSDNCFKHCLYFHKL